MKALNDYRNVLVDISHGDERAFSTFFHHYYDQLWPFILKFTKSELAAEEVLQEVFLRIWLHRDKLTEVENLGGWMYQVASRECLSYLRKHLSEKKRLICLPTDFDYVDEAEATPVTQLDFEEIRLAVHQAVEKMSPRKREIFQMSRDQGMKPSEIARTLSLSVGTVKNVLSQSLKDIRLFLAQSGFELMLVLTSLFRFF